MMIQRCMRVALMVGSLAALSTPAQAQDRGPWYFGIGAGRVANTFESQHRNLATSATATVNAEADGLEGGIVFGREIGLGSRLALGLQLSASMNGVKWEGTGAGGTFEYSLPQYGVASVVPAIRLVSRLAVTGEAGVGLGRVHEMKTSTTAARYDYDEMHMLTAFGGGIAVQLTNSMDLLARYRMFTYEEISFDTDANATLIQEQVTDEPTANTIWVGIAFRF